MTDIFSYSDRSFKAFSKFYAKAPFLARRSTARMLSVFAFGTRKEAINEINSTMNVRNQKFVSSSIIFRGARATRIDDQQSSTGSIARARSTGWIEQQEGKVDSRTRSQSLLARGNNFDKQVAPSARLKPGRSFITMGSFDLPSGPAQVPTYIRLVKSKYKNKPFILNKKYRQIKRGVYKFVRNKMMLLQNFERKPRKVKHNPWMTNARERYMSKVDLDAEWVKSIEFITKKKKF